MNVRQCRGVLTIRGVVSGYGAELAAKYGEDGVKGGTPTFEDYIDGIAGQAKLSAWQERIRVQVQEQLSSQREQLTPGVAA